MSKSDFNIQKITKKEAATILLQYHYLKDKSKTFKSGYNYGLFKNGELLGAIVFTGLPVPELSKGMLGLERNQQEGLFELSRLCIHPKIQGQEHNITSWFVSRSIRSLRKETEVRLILSYADAEYHEGVIYKACNFSYYGLTDVKKDFWIYQEDGSYVKHSRGSIKNLKGEWRPRSRKHRYILLFDKKLNIRWKSPTN